MWRSWSRKVAELRPGGERGPGGDRALGLVQRFAEPPMNRHVTIVEGNATWE